MIENAISQLFAERDLDPDLDLELNERLDEYESFTDFTDRPFSAFIPDICDALQLDFHWERFAYDPWRSRKPRPIRRPRPSPNGGIRGVTRKRTMARRPRCMPMATARRWRRSSWRSRTSRLHRDFASPLEGEVGSAWC